MRGRKKGRRREGGEEGRKEGRKELCFPSYVFFLKRVGLLACTPFCLPLQSLSELYGAEFLVCLNHWADFLSLHIFSFEGHDIPASLKVESKLEGKQGIKETWVKVKNTAFSFGNSIEKNLRNLTDVNKLVECWSNIC